MRDRNVKRYNDLRQQTAHKSGSHHIPKNKLRVQLTAVAQPTLAPASPPIKDRLASQWRKQIAAIDARLASVRRAYLVLAAIPAFAVGAVIGLIVLGWWLFPVEWTNAGLSQVRPEDQALVVEVAADMFAVDNNLPRAQRVMYWDSPDGTAVCREWQTAVSANDNNRAQRLAYLALAVRGEPCE